MSLIDKTYFVGELNIPNTNDATVLERLNFFIAKYEKAFLQQVMGDGLYAAYKTGIAVTPTPDVIWTELQNGKVYTYNSVSYTWPGLRDTETKQSPIANYVYYHWMRDNATLTAGVGEVKNKTAVSTNVSPAEKMVRTWNEMVDWNKKLFDFLYAGQAVYPAWEGRYSLYSNELFSRINSFNI